jgi:hypothetical protein
MKSAISMMVTGALSGPFEGALTGSKLTFSAAVIQEENNSKTAKTVVSWIYPFFMSTPFGMNGTLKTLVHENITTDVYLIIRLKTPFARFKV